VGTTPSALITHGIETTIVEIDPVVHKFATEYFDLPSNHIAAIEDATVFVKRVKRAQESANPAQYDYIVHDVFTGGAEPVELFTIEFIQGLYDLLKDDGVIAIVSPPVPIPTPSLIH
jgi:spermidine synthase